MKAEGFKGQTLFVVPADIQQALARDSLCESLYLTNIGHFPQASAHHVSRSAHLTQAMIVYCKQGKGWCEFKQQRHSVNAGQVIVLPKNEAHQYGSAEGEFWEIYWIHFAGTKADELAHRLCQSEFGRPFNARLTHDNETIFAHLISELALGMTQESCSRASMKIWSLLGDNVYKARFSNDELNQRLHSVIQYMRSHIEDELSLSALSQSHSISASQLCRLFQTHTQHSPMDYFIRLKIQRSCQYLSLTTLKIKEVAQSIGYEDPYYFSRIFRKIMGCSPSEYRERFKN